MSLVNRLKMLGGILVILLLMFGLTLLFNQRQQSVSSQSAVVDAPYSNIGSAYGGVIIQQGINQGDRVNKGQKLFVVSSSSLQQDIARGASPQSNVAYDIDPKAGTVTYKAVGDGYVSDVQAYQGGFVNDGGTLATIVASGQRTVKATYELAPADYGRIEPGGRVDVFLPNNAKVVGTISGVAVAVEEGRAITEVTVTAPELDDAQLGLLANRGTPVTAVMKLRDDGPLAGPTQALLEFLTKIGLR